MSRKESRFYVTNFIDPWINLKKKLTRRAMKVHIQVLYKDGKSERRRCAQGL